MYAYAMIMFREIKIRLQTGHVTIIEYYYNTILYCKLKILFCDEQGH